MNTNYPRRSIDVPATVGFVKQVEKRLDNKVESNELGTSNLKNMVKLGFAKQDLRFQQIEKRLTEVDQRFDKVDQRFDKMESRFDKQEISFNERFDHHEKILNHHTDEFHKMKILIEEQNARNIYVIDGYNQLYAMIDEIKHGIELIQQKLP